MNIWLRLLPAWARWTALVALVAAFGVLSWVAGLRWEQNRRDAIDARQAIAQASALTRALAQGRIVARAYADYRTRAEETERDLARAIERAPARSLYRVECPAEPRRERTPPAVAIAAVPGPAATSQEALEAGDPPAVRVSWHFVRLWDGVPAVAGMHADPGGAADTAEPLSPFGPRELLANHRDNAGACEIDRERFRRLIEFIRIHQQETPL